MKWRKYMHHKCLSEETAHSMKPWLSCHSNCMYYCCQIWWLHNIHWRTYLLKVPLSSHSVISCNINKRVPKGFQDYHIYGNWYQCIKKDIWLAYNMNLSTLNFVDKWWTWTWILTWIPNHNEQVAKYYIKCEKGKKKQSEKGDEKEILNVLVICIGIRK